MWCTFCNGPHPSNKCAVITDPERESRELNELIKKEETTLLSGKPAVEPTKSVETENIDQPKSTNSNAMSEEIVVKVMGVMWDKSEDC